VKRILVENKFFVTFCGCFPFANEASVINYISRELFGSYSINCARIGTSAIASHETFSLFVLTSAFVDFFTIL